MESVEELCSHIGLINRSQLVLRGPVRDIRKAHKSNTYELSFRVIAFLSRTRFGPVSELLDVKEEDDHQVAFVKMLDGHTPNQLLQLLLPNVEVPRTARDHPDHERYLHPEGWSFQPGNSLNRFNDLNESK